MLHDIPYESLLNNGRKYDVWMLRDVYDNTFADIAREYNVSVPIIISNYEKILLLKMKYYVNHLSIVHGYENGAHFRKICTSALDCYCRRKYVVAFFEKEYADILKEYRNGEPGMPEQFLQDLPPFRNKFSVRTISSVVRLRETEGLTYADIGKRLRMTKEKAEHLYNDHYRVLFIQLLEKIMEITGDADLCDKYWKTFRIGSEKKKFDCLVADYPKLCESFLKEKGNAENH